jgi:hypothetical protein
MSAVPPDNIDNETALPIPEEAGTYGLVEIGLCSARQGNTKVPGMRCPRDVAEDTSSKPTNTKVCLVRYTGRIG